MHPDLLYAVEACPVNRWLKKSLQFSVTRILMKIFKNKSSDIVMECQNYLVFYTISTLIRKGKATFLYKLVNSQNKLCELFSFVAQEEILFSYLACYCFVMCCLAVSAASHCAYTLFRGVYFLFCLVFVCICTTSQGE